MKALVKINYKSGISETHWFEEFEVEYKESKLTKVNWRIADSSGPLFIGIDSIESVYQLETVEE